MHASSRLADCACLTHAVAAPCSGAGGGCVPCASSPPAPAAQRQFQRVRDAARGVDGEGRHPVGGVPHGAAHRDHQRRLHHADGAHPPPRCAPCTRTLHFNELLACHSTVPGGEERSERCLRTSVDEPRSRSNQHGCPRLLSLWANPARSLCWRLSFHGQSSCATSHDAAELVHTSRQHALPNKRCICSTTCWHPHRQQAFGQASNSKAWPPVQARAMWCSSCTASWTPLWGGCATA